MEWIGESPPDSPKLWTVGATGVPRPVKGLMVIKPWKVVSPMAVEAYSFPDVASQANPLTVKPTGPISLMSAPVRELSSTSLLLVLHGPPGESLSHAPVVPKRMVHLAGRNCANIWVRGCADACWANAPKIATASMIDLRSSFILPPCVLMLVEVEKLHFLESSCSRDQDSLSRLQAAPTETKHSILKRDS
jgi:hypothetical protein